MTPLLLLSERLEYGRKLREERTGSSVSYSDIARAAGVTPAAVSLWRKDDNAISPQYARKLSDYFGVDPIWLENGTGYPDALKNGEAARHSEALLAQQLEALMRHFFEATPYGRDQLLDFASDAIEKSPSAIPHRRHS